MAELLLTEGAAPGTPTTGKVSLYAKADGLIYGKDDAGLETQLSGGAGYSTEQAQDAVGAMLDTTLVYVDATPLLTRGALTGDVTAPQASNTTTIANNAVTYAKMQDVTGASLLVGRGDSGAGDPQEITLGAGLTMTGTTLASTGGYTDEQAQDTIGAILTDTASIDFTYSDVTPSISAVVIADTTVQQVEVVKNSGAVVGTRKQLNFIEGTNVTLTIADDAGNNQVDISISAASGSGIAFATGMMIASLRL